MKRTLIAAVAFNVNAAFLTASGKTAPALNLDEAPQAYRDGLVNMVEAFAADASAVIPPLAADASAEDVAIAAVQSALLRAVVDSLKDIPDAIVVSPDAALAAGSHVSVRYVGHRPVYKDGTYGTGIVFEKGQSRAVPADKAKLMLAHKDVYEPGDAEPTPIARDEKADKLAQLKKEDADPVQMAVDAVASMTKAALTTYAKTHFRQDLDQGMKAQDMKAHVTNLIHQFGVS